LSSAFFITIEDVVAGGCEKLELLCRLSSSNVDNAEMSAKELME
jgi:hypothetical protein